jgi:hypothetical protein
VGTLSLISCDAGFNSGPSSAWPADFISGGIPESTDRVTLQDLTSFLAPVRRLDKSPGHADFNMPLGHNTWSRDVPSVDKLE